MSDEEKEFHSLTRMEQLRIAEQHIAKLEAQLAATVATLKKAQSLLVTNCNREGAAQPAIEILDIAIKKILSK